MTKFDQVNNKLTKWKNNKLSNLNKDKDKDRQHANAQIFLSNILGTFWTISWSEELGSFFRLLRWYRGSNALLLSTKKPTFRTTWILTYKGLSNILTPLGLALSKLGSIYLFFYIFSIFFVNQKNYPGIFIVILYKGMN